MAGFSKSTWKGFYSSTPVARTLPERRTVDARLAGVDERVRHLRHLRAIQEAMEILEDEEVAHPARNPEISGVLGDPFAGHGGLTDVFGNAIDIGRTGDSLRDAYGPGHVPGGHNNDPGDPRDADPYGRAGQEDQEPDPAKYFGPGGEGAQVGSGYAAISEEEYWRYSAKSSNGMAIWAMYQALDEMAKGGHGADAALARVAMWLDRQAYAEERLAEVRRVNNQLHRKDKPRPDDDGSSGSFDDGAWRARGDLLQWGKPGTDFKEVRNTRPVPAGNLLTALQALLDNIPARYDRLGTKVERRSLSDRDRRAMTARARRLKDASINWGDNGPPGPPGPGRGREDHDDQ